MKLVGFNVSTAGENGHTGVSPATSNILATERRMLNHSWTVEGARMLCPQTAWRTIRHILQYSTAYIQHRGGGRRRTGPPPLPPRSQLCSCVDEREQIFLAISMSTPQVSALQKHVAAAAAAAPLGRSICYSREGRAGKETGKKRET